MQTFFYKYFLTTDFFTIRYVQLFFYVNPVSANKESLEQDRIMGKSANTSYRGDILL